MSENVDHPAHCGGDTQYESIKVIEAWNLGFHLGNAVKYISRAGKKTSGTFEDIEKAIWYLERFQSLSETREVPANLKQAEADAAPEAEYCWPAESFITIRYVPRASDDPFGHMQWTENMTGREMAGVVSSVAASRLRMSSLDADRATLKIPPSAPLDPTSPLRDVANPGQVFFL